MFNWIGKLYTISGVGDNAKLPRHLQPNTLKWMRYHGSRKRKTLSISSYDIVITTFETLVRQRKKHMDPKCLDDTLFSYSWHRIVLDEGELFRLSKSGEELNIVLSTYYSEPSDFHGSGLLCSSCNKSMGNHWYPNPEPRYWSRKSSRIPPSVPILEPKIIRFRNR